MSERSVDKKTEALKLALESLVDNRHYIVANERTEYLEIYDKSIDAIEKALAEQPAPVAKPHEQQELAEASVEPVACKTLCELCVKRGYHFCANAAQTTPIPSPPNVPTARASKPLTDEQRNWVVATCPTPRHIIDTVEKMHGIKGDA